jgi:molybdenum cofactor cytidylyltransferase
MDKVWALILAAGQSARMKTNKLLLPFQGKTLIEHVIGQVMQTDIPNLLLVLGAFREEMMAAIRTLPVQYCLNEAYEQGMLSSVQCGLRNIPATAEVVLVFPGDQPLIPAAVTLKLLEAHRKTGRGLVVPVYGIQRGHPLLIHKKYWKTVEELDHGEGLRGLFYWFPDDVLEVETEVPGILRDVDTPEDYQQLTQLN